MLDGCWLLQEQLRGLKHPQAKDFLNYVKWRQTVHFKKLENPKVGKFTYLKMFPKSID